MEIELYTNWDYCNREPGFIVKATRSPKTHVNLPNHILGK